MTLEEEFDEVRQQIIAEAMDLVHFLPIMDPHPDNLRERAERLIKFTAKLIALATMLEEREP